MNITVAPEYGYVIASAIFSSIVITGLGVQVGMARKKFDVPYPTMYVEESVAKADKKKMLYNCYQRAHQNSLEGYSTFLVFLMTAGLRYPTVSAALGAIWSLGRIMYARGYQSGEPKKRGQGAFGHIGELGLMVLSGKMAWDMLMA